MARSRDLVTCEAKQKGAPPAQPASASANPPLPPPTSAGRPTDPQAQAVLDGHNANRAKHCVPALTWSASLAAGALEWAKTCQFKHSCQNCNVYGENIAMGYDGSAATAVKMWYGEVDRYDFNNPIASYSAALNDPSRAVGHFTQMVWKDTR